ncbi:condensin-2 complex subunit H2-like isoform X2 [Athalia rosae]|uniref:condensin-2 complex subunit H2-like isoform X2 n=1 Tax=Athalia rosae TaxID=37344 RepID=UPI00203382C0|nr:condensin-2 complex subunit H2-like isoform X2 [Athalia rosae]
MYLLIHMQYKMHTSLEKYSSSLREGTSVNFGEAGLVLQKSTDVYARRVEYLWSETESLNQSLNSRMNEQAADEVKKEKKRKQPGKSVIDFNDFESLNFTKHISRSIDLKNGHKTSLKLLTRRFTQLETNLSQLSAPIEILSAQGEVIGKKYDFRCNQPLSKDGMLVDELTPIDFCREQVTSTSIHDSTVNVSSQVLFNDSGIDLDSCGSLMGHESIANNLEIDSDISHDTNLADSGNIPDETDAGYTSGGVAEEHNEQRLIRIESLKRTPDTADIGEKVLEPIPFEHCVPEKIPRRRTEFRLPCHFSLLKSQPRKRKYISPAKRREHLTRLLLNKYEQVHNPPTTYSPTKQLLASFKNEEFEEFQKSLENYVKSLQSSEKCQYEAVTTGSSMDLLGFQPNFGMDLLTGKSAYVADDSFTDSNTIAETESDLSSVPESFVTPPPTPEAANHQLTYRQLIEHRMRQIREASREQSDLEKRVAEWHKSLKSELVAAGRRPPFHIHEYSSNIIKTLESSRKKKVPFRDVVAHQPAPEVARYFLASLQLANTYNVAINTTPDADCNLELSLLNTEKHHNALYENIGRLKLHDTSDDRTVIRVNAT